ncbi:MAG: hypothetical protein RI985_1560 [Chloroflexota bacterium]
MLWVSKADGTAEAVVAEGGIAYTHGWQTAAQKEAEPEAALCLEGVVVRPTLYFGGNLDAAWGQQAHAINAIANQRCIDAGNCSGAGHHVRGRHTGRPYAWVIGHLGWIKRRTDDGGSKIMRKTGCAIDALGGQADEQITDIEWPANLFLDELPERSTIDCLKHFGKWPALGETVVGGDLAGTTDGDHVGHNRAHAIVVGEVIICHPVGQMGNAGCVTHDMPD